MFSGNIDRKEVHLDFIEIWFLRSFHLFVYWSYDYIITKRFINTFLYFVSYLIIRWATVSCDINLILCACNQKRGKIGKPPPHFWIHLKMPYFCRGIKFNSTLSSWWMIENASLEQTKLIDASNSTECFFFDVNLSSSYCL